jgi:hypothetical protein
MGTLNALATAFNVPSEGEVLPVSIFESMPGEILAAAASSAKASRLIYVGGVTSSPIRTGPPKGNLL